MQNGKTLKRKLNRDFKDVKKNIITFMEREIYKIFWTFSYNTLSMFYKLYLRGQQLILNLWIAGSIPIV